MRSPLLTSTTLPPAVAVSQARALERLARGEPLHDVLAEVALMLERASPGMRCCVLVVDHEEGVLRHGASPSLSADFAAAVDGLPIGPPASPCSVAAATREPVLVPDLAVGTQYAAAGVAAAEGIRSCWATPIVGSDDRVLGTFAIYHDEPWEPGEGDPELVAAATHVAGIAIERTLREEALQRSERLYRFVVDGVSDLLFVIDVEDGGETYRWASVNRAYLEVTGQRPEDVVGRRIEEVLLPDEAERARDHNREAIATRGPVRYRDEIATRRGRVVLETTLNPVFGADGRCTHLLGASRDITEQNAIEQKLEESRRRLEVVFNGVADFLFVIEVDEEEQFRHLAVNEAYLRATGKQASDIVGRPLDEVLPPDEAAEARRHNRLALERRAPFTFRERVEFNGEPMSLHTTLSPVFDEDGTCSLLLGVARNISEEESLAEQLRQAQKMEAVGRLAGGIAHDFNNLLTAITGYSELALTQLPPEHPAARDVEDVRVAASRAATLTAQLLTFSRRDVVRPRLVDVNETIARLEHMLRRLIGAHIELVCTGGSAPALTMIDPTQLEQIVLNLVINARDAMPEGGLLEISAQTDGIDVELVVSDNGTGMDERTRARAFEPFFTTKEQGKGTGLGLSTAYGIVQHAGGSIELTSERGRGTRVVIRLPAASADAAPPVETPQEEPPRGSGRVLLVEDQDVVRDLARRVLEDAGYDVLEASNGVEALDVARRRGGELDLLVTDLVMPQMGGRELAVRLRSLVPELPVLFMSGFAEHDGHEDAPLLSKPFTPAELVHAVAGARAAA